MSNESILERTWIRIRPTFCEYRSPFLSGFLAGLLAHGFAFSNKLVNADEVSSIFGKGATIGSGRWALPFTSWLFPNVSMPWVYGSLSLIMLAAASCLILYIFSIQSPLLRLALPAVILCFPAQTSTFSYMFTAPSYALSFLLAVSAVALAERDEQRFRVASLLLLVLSLGIFQAYVSIASSFFVILMIQRLLEKKDARQVLIYGLRKLGLLITALLIYYALALLFLKLYGWHFESYGVETQRSFLMRIAIAYSSFLRAFTRGYFGFVRGPLSMILHGLCAIVICGMIVSCFLKEKEWNRRLLLLVCIFLLPLSINCLYLIASVGVIGSHVQFGFIAVYVLAAMVTDKARGKGTLLRDVVLLSLVLVTAGNVYFANKCYLKMHLDYENAYSLFTGIAAQVRQTEGYDETKKVALVGKTKEGIYSTEELSLEQLTGPNQDLINIYTRQLFLQRFVGFDVPMADEATIKSLARDPLVKDMPAYPAQGCIQIIGDYIVVKLG